MAPIIRQSGPQRAILATLAKGTVKSTAFKGATMNRKVILAPGDVLFIPAGVPHKTMVSSKDALTYVLVKTPK
jgi:uncharacterized RmlC-like cupin family protein